MAKTAKELVPNDESAQDLPEGIPFLTALNLLLAAVLGAIMAIVLLPAWLPGLQASLLSPEPKAYWYLSRASGLVAFGLLWLSMLAGLTITNKMARLWPGGPLAFDLHQHVSLLGLAFGLFHGLILLGDRHVGYTIVQVLMPFFSGDYRPFWVGLGQLGFYLLLVVSLSFYVRQRISHRRWRQLHFLSFAVFVLVLVHGLASGSDTGTPWVAALYWLSGGSVLFLLVYRILTALVKRTVLSRTAS